MYSTRRMTASLSVLLSVLDVFCKKDDALSISVADYAPCILQVGMMPSPAAVADHTRCVQEWVSLTTLHELHVGVMVFTTSRNRVLNAYFRCRLLALTDPGSSYVGMASMRVW